MTRLVDKGIGREITPHPQREGGLKGTITVKDKSVTVDVVSGDPIVYLDSRSPMEPRGLEHERRVANRRTSPHLNLRNYPDSERRHMADRRNYAPRGVNHKISNNHKWPGLNTDICQTKK